MDANKREENGYAILLYIKGEIKRQLREGKIPDEAIKLKLENQAVGWVLQFYLDLGKISDKQLEGW